MLSQKFQEQIYNSAVTSLASGKVPKLESEYKGSEIKTTFDNVYGSGWDADETNLKKLMEDVKLESHGKVTLEKGDFDTDTRGPATPLVLKTPTQEIRIVYGRYKEPFKEVNTN